MEASPMPYSGLPPLSYLEPTAVKCENLTPPSPFTGEVLEHHDLNNISHNSLFNPALSTAMAFMENADHVHVMQAHPSTYTQSPSAFHPTAYHHNLMHNPFDQQLMAPPFDIGNPTLSALYNTPLHRPDQSHFDATSLMTNPLCHYNYNGAAHNQFENTPGLEQGNIYADTFLCSSHIKSEQPNETNGLETVFNSSPMTSHPVDPYPHTNELFGDGWLEMAGANGDMLHMMDPGATNDRRRAPRRRGATQDKNKPDGRRKKNTTGLQEGPRPKRMGKAKVTDLIFNKTKRGEYETGKIVMTSTPPDETLYGSRPISPVTIEFHTDPAHTDPRELERFAEQFKRRRIKLEMTQTDVGRALTHLHIPGVGKLSQSTICRFESLTLSHNNMIALKPILKAWVDKAEKAFESWDIEYLDDILPRRNKRRRTAIATQEKIVLEECFRKQRRPSGKSLSELASRLDLPKNVVRVWFCNRRQKDRKNVADDAWMDMAFHEQISGGATVDTDDDGEDDDDDDDDDLDDNINVE